MNELGPAEKHLRAELERSPDHGMANFRLGQVLLATSREAEAIAPLARATVALPDRWEVRRELGKAYRKTGKVGAPPGILGIEISVIKFNTLATSGCGGPRLHRIFHAFQTHSPLPQPSAKTSAGSGLPGGKKSTRQCAGINRHTVGDESALQERNSETILASSFYYGSGAHHRDGYRVVLFSADTGEEEEEVMRAAGARCFGRPAG